MVVKGFSATLNGAGSSPLGSLARSAPVPNLSALAPRPAPVPTYGVPVPVSPGSPATYNPYRVSGQLPIPPVPAGRPPGAVSSGIANILGTMQMGQQSRYLGPYNPPPVDPYRYLPGLFGGGENLSGAAPLDRYWLPALPPRGVAITYAPPAPNVKTFDPESWTDY